MTNLKSVALLLGLFGAALCPSVAAAQPSSPEQADSQTPYGKELSHINGTPVKVGEHNEYYYDNKRFNLSVNPLGIMTKWISVAGSVAVTDHLAVRGDLSFYAGEGDLSNVTLGGTLYFKKMYSGFFVEPGVGVLNVDSSTHSLAQVITGWHWTYDSGFNIMAGFGIGRSLGSETDDEFDYIPTGVFKTGYAF
jgi:hypothetical protein